MKYVFGLQLFMLQLIHFIQGYPVKKSLKLFQKTAIRQSNICRYSTRSRDGLGQPKGYLEQKYVLQTNLLSGLPDLSKPFLVLGIETSCDDTGVAVVSSNGTILSNVVYSQYSIHERFGGVVPSLAMEAHKNNIEIAISEALEKASLSSVDQIDAIAVTKGPGLEICLRVGLRRAQLLASLYKKPFVTVHHLEAHCLIARLVGNQITNTEAATATATTKISTTSARPTTKENSIPTFINNLSSNPAQELPHFIPKINFPFLVLLVSGGHTSLLVCRGLGNFVIIGGTLDDSLGEAFDKASRLLGLRTGGSGGAAVEQAAKNGNKLAYEMSVPMRDRPNCDFSYAGLKNAFRMSVQMAREREGLIDSTRNTISTNAPAGQMMESPDPIVLSDQATADLCASFQHTAFQHIEDRVSRAMDYFERIIEDETKATTPVRNIEEEVGISSSSNYGSSEVSDIIISNIDSSERQPGEGEGVVPVPVPPVRQLVVVGGVAANLELRSRLLQLIADKKEKKLKIIRKRNAAIEGSTSSRSIEENDLNKNEWKIIFPPPALCTDNGVMAAWAGIEKLTCGISDDFITQEAIPRWPLGGYIDKLTAFRKKDSFKDR